MVTLAIKPLCSLALLTATNHLATNIFTCSIPIPAMLISIPDLVHSHILYLLHIGKEGRHCHMLAKTLPNTEIMTLLDADAQGKLEQIRSLSSVLVPSQTC